MSSTASTALANNERARFSTELSRLGMKPLWERDVRLAPGTAAIPTIWRWEETRPQLMRATELITAREAERRVLMLENPALAGSTFITTTLYAGLQVILPGEVAPSHRTHRMRCASSLKATARTPRSMARGSRCAPATSSLHPAGPGMTTATWARSRWCGSMGWTSHSQICSARTSVSITRMRCSFSLVLRTILRPATALICCLLMLGIEQTKLATHRATRLADPLLPVRAHTLST